MVPLCLVAKESIICKQTWQNSHVSQWNDIQFYYTIKRKLMNQVQFQQKLVKPFHKAFILRSSFLSKYKLWYCIIIYRQLISQNVNISMDNVNLQLADYGKILCWSKLQLWPAKILLINKNLYGCRRILDGKSKIMLSETLILPHVNFGDLST